MLSRVFSMGGTSYPDGRPPANDLHRSPPHYFNTVHAQKNIIKARYQQSPDFKQLPYPSNGRSLPVFGTVYNSKPLINSYPHVQHEQVWLEPFPRYSGSQSTSNLCASPPVPNTTTSGEHSQGLSRSFVDGSSTGHFMTQYPPPTVVTNTGLPVQHHIFPSQPLHPPFHPSLYNPGPMLPYIVVHSGGSDFMYSNSNNSAYFDSPHTVYSSNTTNGFQTDRTNDVFGHPGFTQLPSSHVPQQSVPDGYCLNTYLGTNITPLDPPQTDSSKMQPPKKLTAVEEEAYNFVTSFCPLLGEKPYCLPPVKRSKHPDKSIKQLAVGMESEKRVLGSFERFFAEQQIPVLMLCHYPMTGFMQVHRHEMSSPERDLINLPGENSRGTVTLLLLSDVFSVTIVTVSIISGNSDFAYIQKGVQKAAAHIQRCTRVVSRWLAFLGLGTDVRQVIAFPNLKKAVLQRIIKDKQFQETLGQVSTLHVDDLSAPFEEEWSAPEHKQRFRQWMHEKIICHTATLSRENLQLLVGALLSPRLSQVDFVKDEGQISPISESSRSPDVTENIEDVSQLKLTIDGVTKPFDWFMNEYVTSYYPKLDEVTYRVPPIHFNIQSLRKSTDYIQIKQDGSLAVKPVLAAEESKHKPFPSEESKHKTVTSEESKHKTLTNAASTYSVEVIMERDQINYRSDLEDAYNDISNEFMPRSQPQQELTEALRKCHLNSSLEPTRVSMHGSRLTQDLSSCVGLSPVTISVNKSVAEPNIRIQNSYLDSSAVGVQNKASTFSLSSSQSSDTVSSSRKMPLGEAASELRLAASVCVQSLQDVDVLSEVMTKDVRADEGENRVIGALEKLGQHFGPMFIICDYQYNNYLNKLREEMFSKGETRRPIRAFGQTMRAEHDCLILHKKYGVLVVCIKAIGDNFRDWGASEEQKIISTNKILEKAVKQLEREEAMIRHVTSDLEPKLACHKLIALPNMTRDSVQRALAADRVLAKKIQDVLGHGCGLFLCSDELPAKFRSVWDDESGSVWSQLVTWWKQVEQLLKKSGSEVTTRIYRQIVGRYCGLLSTVEVWSSTNPRVEVRNTSEAISECAERFCKLVLLPRQLEALCSTDRRMYLYGPPGCGKTLLLMLKAREWLLSGQPVILVNSRPGSLEGYPYAYGVYKRLQEMMAQLKVESYHLLMIRIDSLHFRAEDLAGVMPSCCVIMDEVSASCHAIIEHLCCLQVRYIWCAGLFEDDRPNTAHTFTSHKMDKIIRCPPVIQSILKHIERDVKLQKPYKDIYQSYFLERGSPVVQRSEAVCNEDSKTSDKENSLLNKSELKKVNVLAETTSNKNLCFHSGREDSPSGMYSAEVSNNKHLNGEHHENFNCPQQQIKDSESEFKFDPESLEERLQKMYGKKQESNRKKEENNKDKPEDPKQPVSNSKHLTGEHRKKIGCSQEQINKNESEIKYDPESLNERFQKKYGKKEESNSDKPEDPKQPVSNSKHLNGEHPKKIGCSQEQINDGKSEVKYDLESLNERLQKKYGKKEENDKDKPEDSNQPVSFDPQSYCSSSAEMGLPTDGPWPHIIDHQSHSQPGNPEDCSECGRKVAQVLEGLVRPDGMRDISAKSQQGQSKKPFRFSNPGAGRVRPTKTVDGKLSSLTASMQCSLPVGHKLNPFSNSSTLTWSDVLIVAKDMPKDCAFVAALRSRQIPVEVIKEKTFQIEDLQLRKLFIAQYKEVTGLERPVIVFVPSHAPDQLKSSKTTSSTLDFHLGQSVGRFTAEDRVALWHMASRSLASLLLILP
ncbi:hypothetical protein BsWGS_27473 [Bradybaena similaris]